jgi:acyl-CoA thioesterase YciA
MELISTHAVIIPDAGFNSNLFGGKLMSWIDKDAVAFAMQVCDTLKMVTIAIDKCIFKKPVKQGQLVKTYAEVQSVGTTSITLHVEARQHNVYTGKQNVALSTHIKFVRVDDEGHPLPISEKVKNKIIKHQKENMPLTK